MTKYVRDTKAGKSVSAYVVLRKDGTECANVLASRSDSGACLVNVFNYGNRNPSEHFQYAKAGGYGYDKFTHALSDLEIDGHAMSDHCGRDEKSECLLKCYIKAASAGPINQTEWDKKAEKIGCRFANYDRQAGRYASIYRLSGLDYLKALGYRVICAI